MRQWVRVNASKIRDKAAAVHNDQFILSPFDIPEAIRSSTTRDGGKLLEFLYIGDSEPEVLNRLKSGVALRIGQESNRLLAIEIPPNAPVSLAESIESLVEQLRNVSSTVASWRSRDNYLAVGEALKEKKQDLVASEAA